MLGRIIKRGVDQKTVALLGVGSFLFLIFFAFPLYFFSTAHAAATPPSIISYQGKLTSSGTAVSTTVSMYFTLFDALTSGNALYTASGTLPVSTTISVTPSSNGFFNVDLGGTGTNSLDPTIFQNNAGVYLEVKIGTEILTPRKRITASPYAYNAIYLNGVAATTTASSSTYIPISDSSGNFNFNRVTSTGGYINGTLQVTASTTLASTTATQLGIGTTAPITQLHVQGKAPVSVFSTSTNADPRSIYSDGGYLYVTNFASNTLQIYDNSDPANLRLINTTSTHGGPISVYVESGFIYVVNYTSGTIQIFQQVNPTNLTALSSITVGGKPSSIVPQGGYKTVIRSASGTFDLYQYNALATGLQTVGISSSLTGSNPVSIDADGFNMFVGTATTLDTISIDSAGSITSGSLTLSGASGTSSVKVQDNYAYVVNTDANKLYTIDVSKPISPVLLGSVGTGSTPSDISVQGRYAYVVNSGGNSLQVFDISSSTAPTLKHTVTVGTAPKNIIVRGRYAYIVEGSSTTGVLRVLDLGGAYIQQVEFGGLQTSNVSVQKLLRAQNGIFAGILTRELQVTGNGIFDGIKTRNLTVDNSFTVDIMTVNQMTAGVLTATRTVAFTGDTFTVSGTTTIGANPTPGYKVSIDAGSAYAAALGINGYVKATGFFSSTTTLDLAELYPVQETCSVDNSCPVYGDAVCLVDDAVATVERCRESYSDKAIGIVSSDPGFTLGGLETRYTRKIALAGRVPLKISTANGIIRVGDRLTTSDTPGVAVKAIATGQTIGVALENYSNEQIGSVLTFVKLGWWTAAAPSISPPPTSASEAATVSAISKFLVTIVDALKNFGITLEQGIVRAGEFVASRVRTDTLCVGGTCVSENELKNLLQKNQIAAVQFVPDSAAPTAVAGEIITATSSTEILAPTTTIVAVVLEAVSTTTTSVPVATTPVVVIAPLPLSPPVEAVVISPPAVVVTPPPVAPAPVEAPVVTITPPSEQPEPTPPPSPATEVVAPPPAAAPEPTPTITTNEPSATP